MAILSKAVYKFNVIEVKMTILFFTEVDKILKIHMQAQKASDSQSNPESKSIDESITPCLMLSDRRLPQ